MAAEPIIIGVADESDGRDIRRQRRIVVEPTARGADVWEQVSCPDGWFDWQRRVFDDVLQAIEWARERLALLVNNECARVSQREQASQAIARNADAIARAVHQ